MAPHLRILAGPSADELVPITNIVNTSGSYKFSSNAFEGEIAVHIKDFIDERGQLRQSDYFEREDRHGVTWSIQVSGRFLTPLNVDDIMFGNIFHKRLKLPTGSGTAIKLMQLIDPSLEHDLLSQTKPWALSPLVATMPYLSYKRLPLPVTAGDETEEDSDAAPSPAASQSSLNILDEPPSFWSFWSKNRLGGELLSPLEGRKHLQFDTAPQRKKYFRDAERRKQVELGPHDFISMDFCYGYLEFHPSLRLRLPGGLSFDLVRYWAKHPVTFVCCQRKKGDREEGEDPWGCVLWCIMIEVAEMGWRVGSE